MHGPIHICMCEQVATYLQQHEHAIEREPIAKDTPAERQQLILDGKRLKDDGRVLALHGVVAECTVQLVSVGVRII